MGAGKSKPVEGRRWPRWPVVALLAALVALVAIGGRGYSAPDNVHAAVYAWAATNPDQDVPIIVQTSGDGEAVVAAITKAGGTVQRQFQIVPAIEAELPIGALASLASNPSVTWISLDAPVHAAHHEFSALANSYALRVEADKAWAKGFTGAGVGVAVVDTGVSATDPFVFMGPDGTSRIVAQVSINPRSRSFRDGYGHGTHVAGIIGGDDSVRTGKYIGVAPGVNLVNVKVSDNSGNSTLADVMAGLEFVYNNRFTYNIRVVNLSLTSSVAQSYMVDPLDSAVEFLWFNGIFVVAAAGNLGSAPDAVFYPPANDPFVMTVGTLDDGGTKPRRDDVPTPWSSSGTTQDGFDKPELLTPGRGIVSVVDTSSYLYSTYSNNVVNTNFFRLSGTSMSAGVMSGFAALLMQAHPDWTPGELKCTLIENSRDLHKPYKSFSVPRMKHVIDRHKPKCNSDADLAASTLLGPVLKVGAVAFVLGAPDPNAAAMLIGLDLGAAGLQSADLSNIDWGAIKWGAIKWSAIKWAAVNWAAIKWSAIKWSAIKWSDLSPDGVDFSAIKWSAIKWSDIQWDAIKWSAINWSATGWDAIKWSAINWSATGWDAIAWSGVNWAASDAPVNWTVILSDGGG